MSTTDDGQDEFLKYRWEFLRRNEEYQKEWKELQNKVREANRNRDEDDFSTYTLEEYAFSKKWNINGPMDPSMSYDDFYFREQLGRLWDPPGNRLVHFLLAPFTGYPVRQLTAEDYERYKEYDSDDIMAALYQDLVDEGKLRLEINLHYSRSKLVNKLEEFVVHYRKILKEQSDTFTQRRRDYDTRHHYESYDWYLLVHDLRKANKSLSQIRDFLKKNYLESADIHTVRDYDSAADRLIRECRTFRR